jgi:hypothetical protein
MSISITATTTDTSVTASSTATTVTVSDPTVSLSETVSLTGFNAGNLLDLSGSTFNVDLSELTDMTDAVVGGTDELVLLDNGAQRRKLFSEVGLSSFNNDLTSIGTLSQASFEIVSTDAGADHGPSLSLYRNSSSPANADELGSIEFYGENDADQKHLYAQIYAEATLVADGGEQGHLNFAVAAAGSSGALEDPTMRLRQYALEILANNDLLLGQNSNIQFEGSGNDAHETTLDVVNPTQDNTVLIPNTSGTLVNNVSGVIEEQITLMELSSTDANAGENPVISLNRNSLTPADNDEMGSIRFFGNNDRALMSGGPQKVFYAGIYCEAPKVDDGGAHKGSLRFNLADGSGGSVGITDPTADVAGDKDPVVIMTTSNLELKECDLFIHDGQNIIIDGNSNKTTLTHVEPTADRSISLPDADGVLPHIASNGGLQHPVLSSDPSSPANGQTYYNSSTHKLRLYANGAFVDLN